MLRYFREFNFNRLFTNNFIRIIRSLYYYITGIVRVRVEYIDEIIRIFFNFRIV